MQGLADGYFILPATIGNYLVSAKPGKIEAGHAAFKDASKAVTKQTEKFLAGKGKQTVDSFHRELGKLLWENCGMGRTKEGLEEAIAKIPEIRERFWKDVRIPGTGAEMNQELEKAGRVADFLELGELICVDALARNESCGGHFREEYQTPEGEALRNDDEFCYAAAWEYKGKGEPEALHKEALTFDTVHLTQRSYK
jgi:succinate dehydrogenase / fumarate reductase flavoprotein subunit